MDSLNVWHREKCYGHKKLAEFPNKALELIPTVFTVLETCIVSVSSKRQKISHTGNAVYLNQGWVFAMAKSIFARTVVKTGNNRQQLAKSLVHKIELKYSGLIIMQH